MIYLLQCNIYLRATNNNFNDTKQGKYIGERSRNLIKCLSEHANAIKSNNINSSVMAAHYTDVHLNIKIEDKTFSRNLLHKFTGFVDNKIFEALYKL